MSQAVLLKAEKRTSLGSRNTAKARAAGMMPAVVYGHDLGSVAVAVNAHELGQALRHHHRLFELDYGDSKETVMVKEVQYNYLGDAIIHLDLARVDIHEKVNVMVEVALKGDAKGALEGGILEHRAVEIELECEAMNIPEVIKVNVSELGVGDILTAGQIELPAGTKLVSDPSTPIAAVVVVVEKEAAEGEEATGNEPEVIARGKEEEAAE